MRHLVFELVLALVLALVLLELNGFLLVLPQGLLLEDIRNEHYASSNSGTKACVRHTKNRYQQNRIIYDIRRNSQP